MNALAKCATLLLLLTVLSTLTPPLWAGSIMVSNDEWMFGNCCLASDSDAQFASNIAQWLTGGSGSILILTGNFGLAGSALNTLLTGDGYGVTQTTTVPASLSGYAAVFVGGEVVDNALLTNYVNGGGNVFLEAGTGAWSNASDEAAAWNPFLNAFGLGLAPDYNNVLNSNIDVSAFQTQGPYGPALFGGVSSVFVDNGNDVTIVSPGPNVQLFTDGAGDALYGAMRTQTAVPEPSTLLLLAGPLLALGLRRSRKRPA
jgi:hypothetical protein